MISSHDVYICTCVCAFSAHLLYCPCAPPHPDKKSCCWCAGDRRGEAKWTLYSNTVEPPLTDILYSGHLLYTAKCCSPDWIYITCNTLQLSEMRTPRYSVKWTDFAVPLVPGLYKIHSIMQTLAGLSHKIFRHRWLIHQMNIILTLVCIVLASGVLSCHRTARESSGTRFRNVQRHGYTLPCLPEIFRKPPKYGSLRSTDTSEVRTPLYSAHFRWHQWCPHYRGFTVLVLISTLLFTGGCGLQWLKQLSFSCYTPTIALTDYMR